MIEVEKRFQPTEEQLVKLLEGAEFLSEKTLHDVVYDFPDLRLLKNKIAFRKRNNGYELKISKKAGVAEEIEKEEEIQNYFHITTPIEEFVRKELVEIVNFTNQRKTYTKEGFRIDVDVMDFGYELIEIELLVANEADIGAAEEKILVFAERFGIEHKKFPLKREQYLKLNKPNIHKELYG